MYISACRKFAVTALLSLVLGGAYNAQAQGPILCTTSAGTLPFVRAEGETELVGDLLLTCTGGIPTATGQPVPLATLRLFLNTNVTSRNSADGNFSEALLIIDEPHSGNPNTTNTLLPCGADGSNVDGSGSCSVTGVDLGGMGPYDGSAGHANVYQAAPATGNAISWSNVPFDAPGPSNSRVLRITNLRVAANLFLNATPPSQIVGSVQISGSQTIALSSPQVVLANVQGSLAAPVGPIAVLSQCSAANSDIVSNAANALGTGGQNGTQFTLSQTEGFAGAFKAKNTAQVQADAGPAFAIGYPADVNQDVPGYSYNTETGFFGGSGVEFPAFRGLNTVGSASNGTRVYFQFTGVPAGLHLFVPTSLALATTAAPGTQTGVAVLTAADVNGAGPFTPAAGNAYGLAPVPVTGTTGMVVYEILDATISSLETLAVPVAAAFLANEVVAQTINVQSGLAPLSTVVSDDAVSPVPRFAFTGPPVLPAFQIQTCGQTLVSTAVGANIAAAYHSTSQSVTLRANVTILAGPVSGGTVTFTVPGVGGPTAASPVSGGTATATLTYSGVAAGNYPIHVDFSGVPAQGVAGSGDASHSLTIGKAQPTIQWPAPADLLQGTPLGSGQLNAVASAPGSLVYTPAAGTILAAGMGQTLLATFTPADATDYLPATKTVSLNVKATLPKAPPFGSFDTPAAVSNADGAVGFTGWALASGRITKVDIWREPNPGEPRQANGFVYIGDADLVPGSRSDIAALYPQYLGSQSAGWGLLVLTNELPAANTGSAIGNGTFKIHAIAHDMAGGSTDLGVKTINVDNAAATEPFGTIDTPAQGGTVSGTFVNFGWVLTPPGKMIPLSGSTIWVYIDDKPVGHPTYNNYRVDVATLFPGYANSQGAVGFYYIDTTIMTNGLHTIAWGVTDSAGVGSGIGSRFFSVQN